jgi:hypothetical protein
LEPSPRASRRFNEEGGVCAAHLAARGDAADANDDTLGAEAARLLLDEFVVRPRQRFGRDARLERRNNLKWHSNKVPFPPKKIFAVSVCHSCLTIFRLKEVE